MSSVLLWCGARKSGSLTTEIVLFLCLVLLVPSCTQRHEVDVRHTFRYNETGGLKSLDPALASYQAAGWLTTQLFSTLVEYDSTLSIVPCLATQWSVDSTGRQWTFQLRTDVVFHDDVCFGSKRRRILTAHDVQYSFERLLHAQTKSTGLWVLRKRVLGGDEFHAATKSAGFSGHCKGITVQNDSTIVLTLTKPFAPFLSTLTMPFCSIIPKEAVEYYGEEFGMHPIGSGPFCFVSWTHEKELVLRKNPQYFKVDEHGRHLPYLENVTVQFMRDSKTEFLEFRNGNIDAVMQIDPTFASAVLNTDGTLVDTHSRYVLQQSPAHTIEYYGILLDTAVDVAMATPLASSRLLRQALNYAIDRERLVRYVLRGKGIAAEFGVLPPSMPGFTAQTKGYAYNPAKARLLLAQAGFPDGKGIPQLTLQMGNNARSASVGEAIQQMWKEIGVSVNLKQVDFPQHLDMVRSGKLHLWRTSWVGDYPDPENFMALFISSNRSPGGPNTTHIGSPVLDSLYESALNPLLTASRRYEAYRKMDSIIVEEAPWVFLYYNVVQRLVHPSVKGLPIDGMDRLVLERVYKTVD